MKGKSIRYVLIAIIVTAIVSIACGASDPTPTEEPPPPTAVPEPTSPPPPTATPEPTPTPEPTSPPPPAVVYEDDFSDAESGWDIIEFENGNVGYRDGYYYAETWEAGGMVWGVAGQNFSDPVIEVSATQAVAPENDNNGFGVMCRVQEDNSGYLLRISGDGFYAIHLISAGSFEELVGWTPSNAINQGDEPNRLRVICDGSTLAMFANGELLAEATDTTYSSGDIALAATTFEEERTEIHFDDLVVRSARSGEEAPPLPAGVLFQDDFEDPTSGWDEIDFDNGSVGYGDGVYSVVSSGAGLMNWGLSNQTFDDVIIDVDVTQVSAPENSNNGFGIMCHVQEDAEGEMTGGYVMRISGDGFYSIYSIVDREFNELVGWTASDAIRQGFSTNHIRAICGDSELTLIVNGEELTQTTDETFTSGDIGLNATTYEDESTEIHFDDLVVTAP